MKQSTLVKHPNRMSQHGVSLVEMALLLPFLLAIIWGAVDLFKVNIIRNKLEQSSYALASTIAGQRELESMSVDALLNSLTEKLANFEIYVAQIQGDNQADWIIKRGTQSGLCTAKFVENTYVGAIPVIADQEDKMAPIIVVQMCSKVSDLQLFYDFITTKEAFESVSIARVMTGNVELGESFAGLF